MWGESPTPGTTSVHSAASGRTVVWMCPQERSHSQKITNCGDPAAGESLKHILKAVSAFFFFFFKQPPKTSLNTKILPIYSCQVGLSLYNLLYGIKFTKSDSRLLVHYHDGSLSRDQGISPSLKLSFPSSFLYLQLAWNNQPSWLPFKNWSNQKYSNCLKNCMSLGTKIRSSTTCSHLVWKQVILKDFNCSSLSEISKKSWSDGKGGSPVKEEKDAKRKYFHSSPVRNRLTTTISKILTGRESVCKVFLNNILFHFQDCCGWILSRRVQWKCFK